MFCDFYLKLNMIGLVRSVMMIDRCYINSKLDVCNFECEDIDIVRGEILGK